MLFLFFYSKKNIRRLYTGMHSKDLLNAIINFRKPLNKQPSSCPNHLRQLIKRDKSPIMMFSWMPFPINGKLC